MAAKKKGMGDAAAGLFRTGADALGEATGAPKKKATPETRERYVTTNLRLRESHVRALRRRAFEVAEAEGVRMDMSAVLRGILDEVL